MLKVLEQEKNAVQSDQELLLVLSVADAVDSGLFDTEWLDKSVDGGYTRKESLIQAIEWLLENRWDVNHGCLWSGHVADWGFVANSGRENTSSNVFGLDHHRVCGIYLQSLLWETLLKLEKLAPAEIKQSKLIRNLKGTKFLLNSIKSFANNNLWQQEKGFYKIHVHLNKEYQHKEFNEADIFALGGNLTAVESGLVNLNQEKSIVKTILERQKKFKSTTVGASLLPCYPKGSFENPIMSLEYQYQNGAQWDWFGTRAATLIYKHDKSLGLKKLFEIALKIERSGSFYEWSSLDGIGNGSSNFRAGAASYINAIHSVLGK